MKTLLLALAMSAVTASAAVAQTVVLVRHAEKADASADPVLSPAGQARAAALAEALAGARVSHVYVTPLQRTRLTAGPAAAAAGLEPVAVSLDGGGAAHVARVVDLVRQAPRDAVVLVVGHSNTVPAIAGGLGAKDVPPMSECEFDRMTVLVLEGEEVRTVTARYGAPTDPC